MAEIAETRRAFDEWYYELEGFAMRAERLEPTKAHFEAAFLAGVRSVVAAIDAYDAETKALPLGHEMPTRGSSTYNWRRSVVEDVRSRIAIRNPLTNTEETK